MVCWVTGTLASTHDTYDLDKGLDVGGGVHGVVYILFVSCLLIRGDWHRAYLTMLSAAESDAEGFIEEKDIRLTGQLINNLI